MKKEKQPQYQQETISIKTTSLATANYLIRKFLAMNLQIAWYEVVIKDFVYEYGNVSFTYCTSHKYDFSTGCKIVIIKRKQPIEILLQENDILATGKRRSLIVVRDADTLSQKIVGRCHFLRLQPQNQKPIKD